MLKFLLSTRKPLTILNGKVVKKNSFIVMLVLLWLQKQIERFGLSSQPICQRICTFWGCQNLRWNRWFIDRK